MTEEYFTNATKAIYQFGKILEKKSQIDVGGYSLTKPFLKTWIKALNYQLLNSFDKEIKNDDELDILNLEIIYDLYIQYQKDEKEKEIKEEIEEKNYELRKRFLKGDLIIESNNFYYYMFEDKIRGIFNGSNHNTWPITVNNTSALFSKEKEIIYYEVNVDKQIEKLKGKIFIYNKFKYFHCENGKVINSDYKYISKNYLSYLFVLKMIKK